MKLLKVETAGVICLVTDDEGNAVLEVIGDNVHWAQPEIQGSSSYAAVMEHRLALEKLI